MTLRLRTSVLSANPFFSEVATMKLRSAWISAALLVALFLPIPLHAQGVGDFLKVVPDDAIGFAVIRQIDTASAKVQALAKLVDSPLPADPLTLAKQAAGVDKGLNEKGSVGAIFLAGTGKPQWVLAVAVADYKQFVAPWKPKKDDGSITEADANGEAVLVARKGAYALIGEATDRAALEKVRAATKDVTAAVTPLRSWLDSQDAAAVLTTPGVKMVAGLMQDGLKQAKAGVAGGPAELQGLAGMLDSVDGLVKSLAGDVTHAAVGVQVDQANNVNVTFRSLFAGGSELAKAAGKVAPLTGGPLAGLPAGPFVIAGGGVYPEGAAQALNSMGFQVLKQLGGDLPPDKAKKVEEAQVQMAKGLRGMTMLWGTGKANDPLFSSMVGVIQADDAPAYLAGYEKALAAVNELLKEAKQPLGVVYGIKKVQVAGAPALELTTDLTQFNPAGGNDPMAQQMMEKMFGANGKMTISMVAADAKTILMRYAPAAALKDDLQAFKDRKAGLAAEADVAKATAQLPAGAQWALYVSPHGGVEFVNRMMTLMGGPAQQKLPPFPRTAPVAFAVKLSAAGLDGQLVVPVGVLQGIGTFSRVLKAGPGVQ